MTLGVTDGVSTKTLGWSPSCACNAAVVPATVLDPFGGAGTVGLVAERHGRDSILIELNHDYASMAERRIRAGLGRVEGVPTRDVPASDDLFATNGGG